MKKVKLSVLLTAVLILFCICLPCANAYAAAPYYTVIPAQSERRGVLTLENGEQWYKVKHFEDNAEYIMTVQNGEGEPQIIAISNDIQNQYIWSYYRYSMTTSIAPRVSTLTTYGYSMSCSNGRLFTSYINNETGDSAWEHKDTALCYHGSGTDWYLKYDAGSNPPFTMTTDRTEAADVTLYSRPESLERCIIRQPAAESYVTEDSGYPAPEFSVGLPDMTEEHIRWFVDGEEQPCTARNFTADTLTDQPTGIHRVSCQITGHDSEGFYYREQSTDAAFIIAKGVVPDSFITFSDIHEEYSLITDAIAAVMQQTDGYIPALVICSGDFVNGPTAETDTELSRYFPQMIAHLGGLDAVFVAGNHDSAEAAAHMSSAAGLGADEPLPPAGGQIFCGESEAVANRGKSSRFAKGILTYGINFDAARKETGNGILYTYEDVIDSVDSFLRSAAEHYHGELVVISAHSGLHVIGAQPGSASRYQTRLYDWQGENIYNVDRSFDLAQTINRYAEQYHMDILYIFGHDHSRGEAELFLTDGDILISPIRYADRSSGQTTLHFTYANAGYLSSVIGSAVKQFSFVYKDGDSIRFDLLSSAGNIIRHSEIPAKQPYEAPVPAETTAVSSAAETTAAAAAQSSSTSTTTTITTTLAQTTAAETAATAAASQTTAAAAKTAAPDTGDHLPILILAVPVLIVLLSCRKLRRVPE